MKKKKKLTSQQIKFIINLLSLAIFAFSYLYIYSDFVNKTEAAEQEKKITENYIKTTKDKIAQEDAVIQDTKEIDDQIQIIIDSYPVNITKVDNLLFVEQMEKELGITFSDVNPTDSTPFFDTILPMRNADGSEIIPAVQSTSDNKEAEAATPAQAVNNSTTDGKADALSDVEAEIEADTSVSEPSTQADTATAEPTTMTGLESKIAMSFQVTPEEFSRMIDYINDYPSRTAIDSLSLSVDSITNKLTGSLVITRYALAGTGKVYDMPVIDDINIGTDDLFGIDTNKAEENIPVEGQDGTQQEILPGTEQEPGTDVTQQDMP